MSLIVGIIIWGIRDFIECDIAFITYRKPCDKACTFLIFLARIKYHIFKALRYALFISIVLNQPYLEDARIGPLYLQRCEIVCVVCNIDDIKIVFCCSVGIICLAYLQDIFFLLFKPGKASKRGVKKKKKHAKKNKDKDSRGYHLIFIPERL